MSISKEWIVASVMRVGLMSHVVLAAEPGSSPSGQSKEKGATAAGMSSSPVAPAPAAPAPSIPAATPVPALRPITIKFSGEVVSVDHKNPTSPMLTVRDRYGVTKEMSADTSAKMMRGTTAASLDDLKQGDQVSVDYTYDVATGKRHVQTVAISEATAAPAASSTAPASSTSSTSTQQ